MGLPRQRAEWLRSQNAAGCDVYVSVNALAAWARSRTRRDVAVVRHVFLDVDHEAQRVLRQLERLCVSNSQFSR
jgi:hypothetical protein